MDNNNQNRKRPSGQNIGVLALILVITLIAVTVMNNMIRKNQTQELGYEEFVEYLKEGEIDTAKISGNRIYLTPKTSSTKLSRFIQYYTVRIPDSELAERLLDSNGVHVVAEDTSTSASILNFLMGWVLPSALMIGLLYMMYSRMGGGGMMGVGKSNAKVYVRRRPESRSRMLQVRSGRGRGEGIPCGDRRFPAQPAEIYKDRRKTAEGSAPRGSSWNR